MNVLNIIWRNRVFLALFLIFILTSFYKNNIIVSFFLTISVYAVVNFIDVIRESYSFFKKIYFFGVFLIFEFFLIKFYELEFNELFFYLIFILFLKFFKI